MREEVTCVVSSHWLRPYSRKRALNKYGCSRPMTFWNEFPPTEYLYFKTDFNDWKEHQAMVQICSDKDVIVIPRFSWQFLSVNALTKVELGEEFELKKRRSIAHLHSELCGVYLYFGENGLSLQWRHNGHDGVSNHQPHQCLLNRLFGRRSKKTSKLRVIGLCVGNSPVPGEFSAQMASNAENVSIWRRHHVKRRPDWTIHQFDMFVQNKWQLHKLPFVLLVLRSSPTL